THRSGCRGDRDNLACTRIRPETVAAACDVHGDVAVRRHVVDVVVVRPVDEADAAIRVHDQPGRAFGLRADRAARVGCAVADVNVIGAGPIQVHGRRVLGGGRHVADGYVVGVVQPEAAPLVVGEVVAGLFT